MSDINAKKTHTPLSEPDERRLAFECSIPYEQWKQLSESACINLMNTAYYRKLARCLLGRALDNDLPEMKAKYPPRKAGD